MTKSMYSVPSDNDGVMRKGMRGRATAGRAPARSRVSVMGAFGEGAGSGDGAGPLKNWGQKGSHISGQKSFS